MSIVREITQEVSTHRKGHHVGGGWFRGPAAALFVCTDCGKPIPKDTNIVVRDQGLSFTFLHSDCFDVRPKRKRYAD